MIPVPSRVREMKMRRKRGTQFWFKHRFQSAQMAAYLVEDLWLYKARDSNAMSLRLAAGLRMAGATMERSSEADMVFCRLLRAAHERARAEALYYLMDDTGRPLCRLVYDFCKTEVDVDRLPELIADQ